MKPRGQRLLQGHFQRDLEFKGTRPAKKSNMPIFRQSWRAVLCGRQEPCVAICEAVARLLAAKLALCLYVVCDIVRFIFLAI